MALFTGVTQLVGLLNPQEGVLVSWAMIRLKEVSNRMDKTHSRSGLRTSKAQEICSTKTQAQTLALLQSMKTSKSTEQLNHK